MKKLEALTGEAPGPTSVARIDGSNRDVLGLGVVRSENFEPPSRKAPVEMNMSTHYHIILIEARIEDSRFVAFSSFQKTVFCDRRERLPSSTTTAPTSRILVTTFFTSFPNLGYNFQHYFDTLHRMPRKARTGQM